MAAYPPADTPPTDPEPLAEFAQRLLRVAALVWLASEQGSVLLPTGGALLGAGIKFGSAARMALFDAVADR